MADALPVEAGQERSFTPRVIAGGAAAASAAERKPSGVREADPVTAEAAARLARGRAGYRAVKRAFDVAFSLLVLGSLCWLFALITVAVRLEDGGPAIYRQVRVGEGGREFTMYKFRSMRVGADSEVASLAALNEKDGPVFKMADDPRVTRVGRVIRKVSLDELPQFVNVLKGDLSVVGPRPALPSEVAQYSPADAQRLLVRQGITCYWQTRVNRDELSFAEWMELDRLYIRQCGPLTDLKLVIQTVGVVLTGQGT